MTDSNIGGEASILEERRRKLEELRADNKAYINNFFLPSMRSSCMRYMVIYPKKI